MKKGTVTLKGIITLKHIKDGVVKSVETITNTITQVGKADVAGLIGDIGNVVAYKWLELGTSGTEAVSTDSKLVAAEQFGTLARQAATSSRVVTNVTNDTLQLLKTFINNSSGDITLREVGIFNTSTEDEVNALGRQTFGDKTLGTTEELQVIYRIIVA